MIEIKKQSRRFAEVFATGLAATGISPTGLTIIGFFLNLGVAAVLAAGAIPLGGVLLLVAGAFDTLDGALARVSGRSTTFGAFLDSTLDRYSEAALFFGLSFAASRQGDITITLVAYLAIVGSLLVSYCRARAEGLGLDCEVGIVPRPERVVLLGVGLIVGLELPVLIVLALLAHITAFQRIWHVRNLTR
ncbi:MAG TPA: CDP-alcohol phosphatidyltransferase family protein [Chloroflexota bacterium]|nr:CDP-alcohol phosphatidyltransferase family protein [Chloroflexota bacterium]